MVNVSVVRAAGSAGVVIASGGTIRSLKSNATRWSCLICGRHSKANTTSPAGALDGLTVSILGDNGKDTVLLVHVGVSGCFITRDNA